MESHKKVSKAAGVVGVMTLVSRIFGFARDTVIAVMFGSTPAADAFFVAFRIPNLQRRLLGEGAVSAAFIPVFAEHLDSREQAWPLAANVFNLLFLLLALAALLLAAFAPAVVAAFAPGFLPTPEKFDLAVSLTRWMAPYLVAIGLAALMMGILNAHHEFAVPAAAPALLNVSMIGAALFLAPRMPNPIMGLAAGVLVGGALQFAVQLPAARRHGFRFAPTLDWRRPAIARIGKLLAPAVLGMAAYEINIMINTLIASFLPGGSISYLYYANRLVQLPLGLFGVAVGVAILPTLSGHAVRGELDELLSTVSFGIRLILFITIPATVGLVLLRVPIVNTLWEHGEFGRVATEGTAAAVMYYAIGLCAFSGIKVVAPAFYALQDTKTPAIVGIHSMILNAVLCLIFMRPLQHGGLALAASLASLYNVLALLFILRKRLGRIGGRQMLRSALKLAGAAGCMGAVVWQFNAAFFDPADPLKRKALVLLAGIALGLGLFGAASWILQSEELIFLKNLAGGKNRDAL